MEGRVGVGKREGRGKDSSPKRGIRVKRSARGERWEGEEVKKRKKIKNFDCGE